MEQIIFECDNLGYSDNDHEFFKGISFRLAMGQGGLLLAERQELSQMLLKICATLLEPTSGEVTWGGRSLKELSRRQILELRRKLGWVHRGTRLVSNMSIRDNIVLGMVYERNITFEQGYDEAKDKIQTFGLDKLAQLRPDDLSYPQRRLSMYLREIVKKPKLYLFDGPAYDLGEDFELVMSEVKGAAERRETCFLISDTTAWQGLRWADWVLVLNESGAVMHQAEGFDLMKHDPQ
jgi:ABC-type lipoprotein export system ATPase subunit